MDQATIDRLSEAWLPAGALGAAGAIVLVVLWTRQPVGDWPLAGGLLLGVAAGSDSAPTGLAVGMAGGALVEVLGRRLGDRLVDRVGRGGVAVAVVLVVAGIDRSLIPVLVGGALVAVAAITELDARRPGLHPVLMAITVGGVWGTVPDTEEATALLGAAVVMLAISAVVPLRSERLGTVLGVAAVVATIGLGGAARDGAVVGATIALLSLASAPLVRRWTMRRPPTIAVLGAHLVVVFIATRVGGLRTDAASAAAIGGAALVVCIAALGLVTRRLVAEEER